MSVIIKIFNNYLSNENSDYQNRKYMEQSREKDCAYVICESRAKNERINVGDIK